MEVCVKQEGRMIVVWQHEGQIGAAFYLRNRWPLSRKWQILLPSLNSTRRWPVLNLALLLASLPFVDLNSDSSWIERLPHPAINNQLVRTICRGKPTNQHRIAELRTSNTKMGFPTRWDYIFDKGCKELHPDRVMSRWPSHVLQAHRSRRTLNPDEVQHLAELNWFKDLL